MFAFLEHRYDLSKSDDLGALLGSLSLLPDGTPGDPAVTSDWSTAVTRAIDGQVQVSMQLKGG
jgi:hypothetical protein